VDLVIVGNSGGTNVGASLVAAAVQAGLRMDFCDAGEAFRAAVWRSRVDWWLRGHTPTRLRAFSQEVVSACKKRRPRWLLSTGLAPIDANALGALGELGVERLNYLTDDPWNPTCRSRWFFDALPLYDRLFSPRWANLNDLRAHGCKNVDYLPFGYDPRICFPEAPADPEELDGLASDVLFAGGADRDRIPYIAALIRSGVRVALYGDYWERFAETRRYTRGHADPGTLRKAAAATKIALCLVRHANRDGHVMRTFEIPALGVCMLAEDTDEHRVFFGADGEAISYFRTPDEMVRKLRWLLSNDDDRRRLADRAHKLVTRGGHTYSDRLLTMLHGADGG
jgi:hypothetical protein